ALRRVRRERAVVAVVADTVAVGIVARACAIGARPRDTDVVHGSPSSSPAHAAIALWLAQYVSRMQTASGAQSSSPHGVSLVSKPQPAISSASAPHRPISPAYARSGRG